MTEQDIEDKFWKSLKHDRTLFLGTAAADQRPMTALIDDDLPRGVLWIFTARDNKLAQGMPDTLPATAAFASKGHDLFAALSGKLSDATDPVMIDKLWNPFVAAWYEGKDDPKIVLLRFDVEEVQIWSDASSVLAGLKILIGVDPKTDYKDKVAHVEY